MIPSLEDLIKGEQIQVRKDVKRGTVVVIFGPEVVSNANVRLEMLEADADRLQQSLYQVVCEGEAEHSTIKA